MQDSGSWPEILGAAMATALICFLIVPSTGLLWPTGGYTAGYTHSGDRSPAIRAHAIDRLN